MEEAKVKNKELPEIPAHRGWWWELAQTHPDWETSIKGPLKPRPLKPLWYRKIVRDFKGFERNEAIEVIKRRHELGLRILKHRDHVPIDLHYYLGCSRRELKDCLLFAQKYPDVEAAIKEFSRELPPHAVNWANITSKLNGEAEKAKLEERERRRRLELYNQLKAEFEGNTQAAQGVSS